MKVFLIHPIREAHREWEDKATDYVATLEKEGHEVYWPKRDTNQDDPFGFAICADNRIAIQEADEVHVMWDGNSKGCIFDLGMAFEQKKQIVLVRGWFPLATEGKSFANMVRLWEKVSIVHPPFP